MNTNPASVHRRSVGIGVLVVALALVPAAIAWACNPQAHISLNGTTFSPGQSITVYGSFFAQNASVRVNGAGGSATVTTSGGGSGGGGGFAIPNFTTAPSQPGTYTITASRPTGGFAATSFQVVAPVQQSQPAPASGGETSQPPAPAPQPQQQSDSASRFTTPGVARSERQSVSRDRDSSGSNDGSSRSGTEGSTSPRTTAPVTPAQPVFSGSSAPAATSGAVFSSQPSTTGATTRSTRRNGGERSTSGRSNAPAAAAEPSQQTAFSDVWSGYQPGRTASLTAASAAAADDGPGSELAWGIGLLAIGLFALVGGLAYTEARRRRVA